MPDKIITVKLLEDYNFPTDTCNVRGDVVQGELSAHGVVKFTRKCGLDDYLLLNEYEIIDNGELDI